MPSGVVAGHSRGCSGKMRGCRVPPKYVSCPYVSR